MQSANAPVAVVYYGQRGPMTSTRTPSIGVVIGIIISLIALGVAIYYAIAPLLQNTGGPPECVDGEVYTPGDFVEVVFTNNFPSEFACAFTNAAKKWSNIINGTTVVPESLEGFGVVTFKNTFGCVFLNRVVRYNEPVIDHLVILAEVISIDGVSNILAQAYPCGWIGITEGTYEQFTENTSVLPTTGHMQFDSADIGPLAAAGRLEDTVLHEMGHVLGIGTFWDINFTFSTGPTYALNLLQDPVFTLTGFVAGEPQYSVNAAATPTFSGVSATSAYQALGGSGEVPVENGGPPFNFNVANREGLGTIDSHWDEEEFQTELMTGLLNTNGANPLSTITAESLRDLGYTVDSSQADSYSLPTRRLLRGDHEDDYIKITNDVLHVPLETVQQILSQKIERAKKSGNHIPA